MIIQAKKGKALEIAVRNFDIAYFDTSLVVGIPKNSRTYFQDYVYKLISDTSVLCTTQQVCAEFMPRGMDKRKLEDYFALLDEGKLQKSLKKPGGRLKILYELHKTGRIHNLSDGFLQHDFMIDDKHIFEENGVSDTDSRLALQAYAAQYSQPEKRVALLSADADVLDVHQHISTKYYSLKPPEFIWVNSQDYSDKLQAQSLCNYRKVFS